MALSHVEEIENLEDTFKENKSEYIDQQINSSAIKTSAEKMKKGIEEITMAMENAHNTAFEKKIATDEIRIQLSRKKDEIEKLQNKLEKTRKRVESDTKKTSDLKIEVNKIRTAIEKIKEVGQNLDQKYLEQSQSDLTDALVKVTSEAEKAQSNLNVAKKIEGITLKKLEDVETDFNESKLYALNKISETETMLTNVSIATEQIVKSYDEITTVSKELLKSATNTTVELKEAKNYELEQNQQNFTDSKVSI